MYGFANENHEAHKNNKMYKAPRPFDEFKNVKLTKDEFDECEIREIKQGLITSTDPRPSKLEANNRSGIQ